MSPTEIPHPWIMKALKNTTVKDSEPLVQVEENPIAISMRKQLTRALGVMIRKEMYERLEIASDVPWEKVREIINRSQEIIKLQKENTLLRETDAPQRKRKPPQPEIKVLYFQFKEDDKPRFTLLSKRKRQKPNKKKEINKSNEHEPTTDLPCDHMVIVDVKQANGKPDLSSVAKNRRAIKENLSLQTGKTLEVTSD